MFVNAVKQLILDNLGSMPSLAEIAAADWSLTPGRYEGSFSLAVGINTDPLEAVRLCHSLLSEWCANADTDYKLRLKLSP